MKKTKEQIFKMNLIEILDHFLFSLEAANRQRRRNKQDELPIDFENFLKWLFFERNKKLEEKFKKDKNSVTPPEKNDAAPKGD
jgi:hypothetical protein